MRRGKEYRFKPLAVLEDEAPAGLLTVDDTGFRPVFGPDRDRLAQEIDVAVSGTGVSAVGYQHGVAIDGCIDAGLDRGLVTRNMDGGGREGQRQKESEPDSEEPGDPHDNLHDEITGWDSPTERPATPATVFYLWVI